MILKIVFGQKIEFVYQILPFISLFVLQYFTVRNIMK